MPHTTLIDATDLSQWSNRRDAQAQLPRIVRRLVRASAEGLLQMAFAADEGVQLGGWDGIVRTSTGNEYAPAGTSYWELGTNGQVKGKADDDYDKRTNDPNVLDQEQATFVFVSSRRWLQKDKWAQARRSEGKWRDVRAYDADDLATWLEAVPAVHIWASVLLGCRPDDALDVDTYWEEWSSATRFPSTPALVIAGRDEPARMVREWLAGPPSILDLQGETVQEALAFFAALLQSLPDEEREAYETRSVIVETAAAWRRLALSESPLVLVPTFADRSVLPPAVNRGHHILLPLGLNEASGDRKVQLERPRRDTIHAALVAMQVPEAQLEELATLGRRSLSALRRRIAVNPAVLTPPWASPAEARALLPALLAGRWHDTCKADQEALAALAGVEYSEVLASCVRWANEADPFLRKVGDTWLVVSRDDSWQLLARFLTQSDLARLEFVAKDVLGTRDPRYELEPEQRFAASIYGRVLPHSGHLRLGLAEGIALMATRREMGGASAQDGQDWADRIVSTLLENPTDWLTWASLDRALPLLAEAAPARFVAAAERLADAPAAVANLIGQEDSRGGGAAHTGLLWALEVLAWSPEHISRTALLLARLARLDPGGRLANRPFASLKQVLLSWYPCTAAPAEQRLRVVDLIRNREPAIAWALLMALLPARSGSASLTDTPSFRDWVVDSTPQVTLAELAGNIREILQRLLDDAGEEIGRWCDLVKIADEFPEPEFSVFADRLLALAAGTQAPADREHARKALREVISKHAAFPEAHWAMPSERLELLRTVYAAFEPEAPLDRHAWLFAAAPRLMVRETDDWRARETLLENVRCSALEEIYDDGGFARVRELLARDGEPWHVGWAIGKSSFAGEVEATILREGLGADEPVRRMLALGCAHARADVDASWLETVRTSALIAEAPPAGQADFHLLLPFARTTWDLVAALGLQAEDAYWRRVSYYGRGSLDDVDHGYLAEMLAEHGRLPDAVHFAAMYSRDGHSRIPVSALVGLLERLAGTEAGTGVPWQDLQHDLAELLGIVEASGEVAPERIAMLEWAFLPLLEYSSYQPKVLHRALTTEPEFFSEVVCWVYKANDEEAREITEEAAHRARLGWELLRSCRAIPGSDEEGHVDSEALRSWTVKARALLQERDRTEIGDQQIGQLLSHAPVGTDGEWPHEAVRDLIEDTASEHLERGIEVGRFNSRGVTTRGLAEGGVQERALADRYRAHARAAQDRWPRTAAMLTEMAQNYDRQARDEDRSADLQQDLWR